jgi:hypothetical protein
MAAKIKGAAIGEDANSTSLTLKNLATADNSTFTLTLQTAEADIAADDIIGTLNFQAPAEGTGTDAILVAAGIEAVSEGDFSSSSNATKLSFKTAASEAAAEKMSLSSAGLLTVSNGLTLTDGDVTLASGHGINFAATSDTAGMSGELLDDYEEGTWTAAFTDGTNNYTMNNSYKTGQYVKIGCVVHIWGYFTVSDVDGGGANENTSTKITGLPFSVSPNNTNNYASVNIGYTNSMALPNALSVPTGYIEISNSYIYLVQNGATDGIIAVTGVHISDGGTLMLSATYRTT